MVVPAVTPYTEPVVEPTVPTAVLLLLHVPPAVPSVNVVVKPTHTVIVPVITPGNGFTVTTAVMIQPVPIV